MVLQPDARPISHEQLAAEVKGIYAGLVMVEAKCINIDNAQMTALREANPGKRPKMGPEQWQALVTLHRTLLYEHHDFLLASQHPSSSPALNRLAAKYSMPAHYMLHFIYLAYSMMALLYETVPAFEDTWIECLGDLARYRMAIEEEDMRDRETWGGVARFCVLPIRSPGRPPQAVIRSNLPAPQIAKVESEHNQDDMESITRQHEHTLPEALPTHLPYAADVTFSIFSVALRRIGDRNVLPHIHVLMVFVRSLSFLTDTAGTSIHGLLQGVPWVELAHFLNTLSRLEPINERVQSAGLGGRFLRSDGDTKPLPEDYLIRGMVWCQSYFEAGWFDTQDDEEGRLLELTSTNSMRAERVLWLGIAMSTRLQYLVYNQDTKAFSAPVVGEATTAEARSRTLSPDQQDVPIASGEHQTTAKHDPAVDMQVKIEDDDSLHHDLPPKTEMDVS
ncbi:hypothetical protein H2203_001478 [Taxawa tesnikishii (nom. ined.)]|nr:hypothetical protein H2203_001478 [Dothideales sp. JES 119]